MATTEFTAPQRSDQMCRQQLLEVGLMASKSLLQRYTVCADAGRLHEHAPPQRQGPYWQYSHKIERKTVTPQLASEQAQRYREWINNRRKLDQIIRSSPKSMSFPSRSKTYSRPEHRDRVRPAAPNWGGNSSTRSAERQLYPSLRR